jgi:hypothetical protein
MYEHQTRHDSSDAKVSRPARAPQGADLSAAGNRAMRDVLAPRPVQRWPDLDDLGGLLGGGPSMGDPTPDLGGYMPSLPSLPSMPDLGGLLPSMPSMPQLNIPGVNLNVDTDAGTASGGIDFHDGTAARASYGPVVLVPPCTDQSFAAEACPLTLEFPSSPEASRPPGP